MQPHSRTNSASMGAQGRFSYPPLPNSEPASGAPGFNSQVKAAIAMVQEQEREAIRLRDSGQISAAMDQYSVVVKFCGDAGRKLGRGPMAEVWCEKKLQLQKDLETLAATGGYLPAAQRPPTLRTFARPAPPTVQNIAPEIAEAPADNVAVPPSRVGGFRNPVTTLNLEEATWGEYTAFTRRLKEQADALKGTDVPGAVEKLREAADIWNYAVSSPRFHFFGTMRATAREVADNYMSHANALQNPGGTLPAVNGPASSQAEAAEMDRRVRDCIITETPTNKVGWSQIIGAKEAKDALLSALIDRYIYKGAPENEGRGVLLYGPAGTGKTMLVRGAVNLVSELLTKRAKQQAEKRACQQAKEPENKASESSVDDSNATPAVSENETQDRAPETITLFMMTAGDVDSKWVGEGTKFMQCLFKIAREEQPAIIFIDEADALFSKRGDGQNEATAKIMTQFMQEVDGLTSSGNITVIAATNQPQKLDDAILRRLQRDVYVPAPAPEDRAKILEQQLKAMPCPSAVPFDALRDLALSKAMHNFTGADIKLMLKKAREQGPERDLHDALAFREVGGELEPCDVDAPGARVGHYLEFFGEDFKQLPVTLTHLQEAARAHRPTASKQIPVLEKWKAELEASKS